MKTDYWKIPQSDFLNTDQLAISGIVMHADDGILAN